MQIPKEVKARFIQKIEDAISDGISDAIYELNEDVKGEEFDDLLDNDLYRAEIRLELMLLLSKEYFEK